MPPIWNPDEPKEYEYEQVEQHSEGMISFTYRPPTAENLAALKNTQTYRSLMQELDQAVDKNSPPDASIAHP